MIAFGPHVGLHAAGRCAVGLDGGQPAAVGVVNLVFADPVPLLDERIPVSGRFLADVLMLQEQGVELFGLDPPNLLGAQAAGDHALGIHGTRIVKAAELVVPAVLQGVIHQMTRGRPRARVVLAQDIGRFNHEIAGFHVVAEGVGTVGSLPVGGEELREVAWLGINLVAADFQHFLNARLEQRVGPDLIKAGQGFEDVYAGVHGFLAGTGADRVAATADHRLAISPDIFEVTLVHVVMRVFLKPLKGFLGQVECGRVLGGLVAGGQGVNAEGMAIHLLGVRNGLAIGADLPVKAAAGFVPEFVRQTGRAAPGHVQI